MNYLTSTYFFSHFQGERKKKGVHLMAVSYSIYILILLRSYEAMLWNAETVCIELTFG